MAVSTVAKGRWRRGAVALAVVLGTGACAGPTPVPSVTHPTGVDPTPVLAANASPTPTPTSRPVDTRAPVVATFVAPLIRVPGAPVLDLTVADRSGHVTGVATGDPSVVPPSDGDPTRLAVLAGATPDSVLVQLITGGCDAAATLDVASDGRHLTLTFPPRDACDQKDPSFVADLTFDGPVDAADFDGSEAQAALTAGLDPEGTHPTSVAFGDDLHGWVGGTTVDGQVAILETSDGGSTWTVSVVGDGSVAALAVTPGGATAGRLCPDGAEACGAGTWLEANGGWFPAGPDRAVSLAFDGQAGIGLFQVDGIRADNGMPLPAVRVTGDGGLTWTDLANPCLPLGPLSAALGPGDERLALCGGEGAGGGSEKTLYAATAPDGEWRVVGSTGEGGTLPWMGAPARLSIAPDGTGLLWGPRSPLMGTTDAGRTWHDLGVADSETRLAEAGYAANGGAAAALVYEGAHRSELLLVTRDGGATWETRATWPGKDWWWK